MTMTMTDISIATSNCLPILLFAVDACVVLKVTHVVFVLAAVQAVFVGRPFALSALHPFQSQVFREVHLHALATLPEFFVLRLAR